ncbi:hypothetical protein B0T17DRAFT_519664 [Bombardia bombarda]|uniref:NmrA-like domain-containing protein n=1 Tax=Bombardia bombarda TaxID=252184 RepID=A0AA40CFT5_9PEZI|nr:hypothetical protein B0T17DRAFT_519664 [Bombardia bombarda]
MSSTPTVFVCGATGSTGLNLVRQLRELNWTVHATVRDPSSPAAQTLASQGVSLTPGDWDNEAALAASIAGCTMLFLNTVIGFSDTSREREQVASILSIAKAAGVRQVIYNSSLIIDRLEELPTFDPDNIMGQSLLSKRAIEQLLKAAGFDFWTILRGASYMENFLGKKAAFMYGGLVKTGVWNFALRPDDKLPLIDTNDIAKFAVAAFQDPERFNKKDVELSTDLMTPGEIMAVMSKATGREFKFVPMTEEEVEAKRAVDPMISAHLALRVLKDFVDVEEVKSWGIKLATFEEFMAEPRNVEILMETYKGV